MHEITETRRTYIAVSLRLQTKFYFLTSTRKYHRRTPKWNSFHLRGVPRSRSRLSHRLRLLAGWHRYFSSACFYSLDRASICLFAYSKEAIAIGFNFLCPSVTRALRSFLIPSFTASSRTHEFVPWRCDSSTFVSSNLIPVTYRIHFERMQEVADRNTRTCKERVCE